MSQANKQAKALYYQGTPLTEISERLDVAYGTLVSWKSRQAWDAAKSTERLEENIEYRLNYLVAKPEKTDTDYHEIEKLGVLRERNARTHKYLNGGGNEADLNPKKSRKGKKQEKNALTEEQIKALEEAFFDSIFSYQERWWDNRHQRTRNILKSRQIGATWYFAREAIVDAIKTGRNKIFLSASKNQAQVFKRYIIAFIKEITGVEFKGGDSMTLWNGAELYFLGTNARTAQGYHGDVYVDEYCWIGRFEEFRKVTSGMASQKQWCKTYFSTPSVMDHDGYAFWSGAQFNKGRSKKNRVEFDLTHKTLKAGYVGQDGVWRQIISVEDAQAEGCNLFDIKQLRLEYSDHDFNNLFMCKWVDDAQSVFSFKELMACGVDSVLRWQDFNPHRKRPIGDAPVYVGFDPSRFRDASSIVVVQPPFMAGGKFRVLEVHSMQGMDFEAQAKLLRQICGRYNVVHLAVDVSGIGQGVYEMVKKFYASATKITYSVETKTELVLIAKELISKGRIEFDAGRRDLVNALMTIHRSSSDTGRHITYKSSRTKDTGHGDQAWAFLNALSKEKIGSRDEHGQQQSPNIVEII